ncbi:MAG: MerR family transcriptional regulator [Thermoanaerobaculia bacterium]
MAKKLYYKIGEACKRLDIQPYVLRYWETEFPVLAPSKSTSGQRVYSDQDLRVIQRIKELLYEEGYTIAGAKKKLEKEDLSSLSEVRVPEKADSAASEAPAASDVDEADKSGLAKPAARARASKKSAASKAKPRARKKAAAASPAPSDAKLRRGVREALKEARAILEILDTN